MVARTPRARIQKGKDLENHVAARISHYGADKRAARVPGSGNGYKDKRDIATTLEVAGLQLGIECKHHTTLKIQEWWRQTCKLATLNFEPVLVYKQTGDKYHETKAVVYLETLLMLINQAQGVGKVMDIYQDDEELRAEMKKLDYLLGKLAKGQYAEYNLVEARKQMKVVQQKLTSS
jgi:hypothetical protein